MGKPLRLFLNIKEIEIYLVKASLQVRPLFFPDHDLSAYEAPDSNMHLISDNGKTFFRKNDKILGIRAMWKGKESKAIWHLLDKIPQLFEISWQLFEFS
jgi:hypothetical protein